MGNLLVVKDKVARFVKEFYKVVMIDDDGDLKIPIGSTLVYVGVKDTSQPDASDAAKKFFLENQISSTMVHVWSPVLVGLKPTADLFEWVATEGQKYRYGGFLISPIQGTDEVQLIFRYSLPGDALDPGELKNSLFIVAGTADDEDDKLQKIFGGKRIEDLNK